MSDQNTTTIIKIRILIEIQDFHPKIYHFSQFRNPANQIPESSGRNHLKYKPLGIILFCNYNIFAIIIVCISRYLSNDEESKT